MKKKASCPTCGTRLNTLHSPAQWRTCSSCNRTNPRAYPYCGWCASPMENTEMRRRMSQVAAPPGGWPSLVSELLEVRFFMERGNFADAFELLAILRQRYPLHPQLEEFTESTRPSMSADTGVHRVVDSLFTDSSSLSGTSVGRRAAPTWNAPRAKGTPPNTTSSHTAVPSTEFDDDLAERRRRPEKRTQRGHQPVSAVPVVPIIPEEKRAEIPNRRREVRKKKRKKRLTTHRAEPQELVQAPMAPMPEVDPSETEVTLTRAPAVKAPEPELEIKMRRRLSEFGETTESQRPAAYERRTKKKAKKKRKKNEVVAQFDATDPGVSPVSVAREVSDAMTLDASDIEELAPTAGVLYSEPETEAALAKEREARYVEASRAAAKRVRQESGRRAAEEAAQRKEAAAMEAARRAVEEAVDAIPERPGAPAVTGYTSVGEPPSAAPAVTGNTVVGTPLMGVANSLQTDTPAIARIAVVRKTAPLVRETRRGTEDAPSDSAHSETVSLAAPAPAGSVVDRAAPRVTVETQIGLPPSADPNFEPPKGLTIAVDALQPAKPFDDPDATHKGRKKRRGRGNKRSMKTRKRSGSQPAAPQDDPQQEAERQERARKRAARFGQGILGK